MGKRYKVFKLLSFCVQWLAENVTDGEISCIVYIQLSGLYELANDIYFLHCAGQTDARDVEPKEVEYSNIDFSRWSRKSPTAAEDMQETTETEYAEIKKDETEDGQDNDREEGDKLEGNDEEVAMIGEDKEAKHCSVANGEDVADVAVHSSVNDITAEIWGLLGDFT